MTGGLFPESAWQVASFADEVVKLRDPFDTGRGREVHVVRWSEKVAAWFLIALWRTDNQTVSTLDAVAFLESPIRARKQRAMASTTIAVVPAEGIAVDLSDAWVAFWSEDE